MNITNQGQVIGEVIAKTQEEGAQDKYTELKVKVKRLSETYDTIPVTLSQGLLASGVNAEVGQNVALKGEFRSYNKVVDGKSKLMLHFYAQGQAESDEPNTIELNGFICKKPVYRVTPFNREICDVLLAVNRPHNGGEIFKSDYIPCIIWGKNARLMQEQPVGTQIKLTGRIQSRDYNKRLPDGTNETRTAYEVSCQNLEIIKQREMSSVIS